MEVGSINFSVAVRRGSALQPLMVPLIFLGSRPQSRAMERFGRYFVCAGIHRQPQELSTQRDFHASGPGDSRRTQLML